ncbi:hypothetical protein EZS27_008054 [termite gut metagenome]|uniref:Uncharacterized protein n=1 Tax=termite gut metagenome TaxID=433724 RepID=A0A5J4SEK3_9ZZZZ
MKREYDSIIKTAGEKKKSAFVMQSLNYIHK